MTQAPRRHPATKALADIRGWKVRWPTTVPEEEHIIAVEGWLRRIAKGPTRRAPAAATPTVAAAKPSAGRSAAKPRKAPTPAA
jgi:hypothetical protein